MKYLVLYMAPAAGLEAWMKLDESVRKPQEEEMMKAWDAWMAEHGSMFKQTAGAGKTKRVTKGSVADVKNDVMLYAIVEAESQEMVAETFKDHPHFGIPDAWIDIMPVNYLLGME
ncbi:MAG TPA: hypothetical protein VGE31_00275 [Candidatus Paceibacterota bacterium]